MDKASVHVDKGSALWTSVASVVCRGSTPVSYRNIAVTHVPVIPAPVHSPSADENLVAVRYGGASPMVHTTTTTAAYLIDRLSTRAPTERRLT